MRKVTKHMYSAGGHYIGSKEVPYWHTWISLPTIVITTISILIGLGIIIGMSNLPHSHNSKVNITNDLPF